MRNQTRGPEEICPVRPAGVHQISVLSYRSRNGPHLSGGGVSCWRGSHRLKGTRVAFFIGMTMSSLGKPSVTFASLVLVAVLVSPRSAAADLITPGSYLLGDHCCTSLVEDGSYGMNMGPLGGDPPTYTTEHEGDPLVLTYNALDPSTIMGQVKSNATGLFWNVDYTMTGLDVLNTPNGGPRWLSGTGTFTRVVEHVRPNGGPRWLSGTGTFTRVVDNHVVSISGKADSSGFSFLFLADCHRYKAEVEAGCPNMRQIARGWVNVDGGTGDFIATATSVPEPSTLLLLGVGLGVVGLRRYRRKQ